MSTPHLPSSAPPPSKRGISQSVKVCGERERWVDRETGRAKAFQLEQHPGDMSQVVPKVAEKMPEATADVEGRSRKGGATVIQDATWDAPLTRQLAGSGTSYQWLQWDGLKDGPEAVIIAAQGQALSARAIEGGPCRFREGPGHPEGLRRRSNHMAAGSRMQEQEQRMLRGTSKNRALPSPGGRSHRRLWK